MDPESPGVQGFRLCPVRIPGAAGGSGEIRGLPAASPGGAAAADPAEKVAVPLGFIGNDKKRWESLVIFLPGKRKFF